MTTNFDRHDEENLVRRAQNGDHHAFAALYHANKPLVVGYLRQRIPRGDPWLVDDITAETFARAWRSLHAYTPRSRLSAWLCTIAHNYLFDHYRKARHETPDGLIPINSATIEPAEETVLRKHDFQHTLAAVRALPPTTRECILRSVAGYTPTETAHALDIATVTMHRRRRDGIQQIHQLLSYNIPLRQWYPKPPSHAHQNPPRRQPGRAARSEVGPQVGTPGGTTSRHSQNPSG
ncbi:RNA polymerase sigma factor [Micromonospora sp. NPDC049257]|uniref:RNA polymerase sigma factor n=1 Tax=Micromonospora sp. NPDC049257 TaxID=3155771 RepID=UPI00343B6098